MEKPTRENGILWPLLRRSAPRYLIGLVMLFVVDYVNLFIPQLTGEVTDGLAAHTMDAQAVLIAAGKIVLCGTLVAAGRFGWRWFIFGSARRVERSMRNQMFEKLETLSQRYYNVHKTGDLMSYFTNDLEAVRVAIGPEVVSAFDSTVLTLLVLWRMFTRVSVKLTLLTLIPMAVIAVGGYFFFELVEKRFSEMQRAFSKLSDHVQETISGERVLKAFVQEEREKEAFRAVNEAKRQTTLRVVRLEAAFLPLLEFVVGVTYVIAIVYGGRLTMTGAMTLGKFVEFNAYIGSLVWPMIALGDSVTYISQGVASLKRIHAVFDERPDIADEDELDDVTALGGEITLDRVSFAHRPGEADALRDLTLKIPKGETLAVMGRTGAGKSTLVNLLCRAYDIDSGSICFDGHDIRRIPLHVLRENIAYVPQDNFLFSDTLRRNLAFGRPEAGEGEIVAGAKDADLHDDVVNFPEGYDTVVGERGVTLSGGQKQRSSIARALLKDAPVLILDDALSAVDTDTEERILANLKRVRAGKTTVMIAHRVSTVQNADHILVLEQGRMAEYGTREELMAIPGGVFRTMAEKQQLERQLQLEE
ncbi:MAG: ABC transporter ATP-binding protein [Oscillospiraceae bacterium]|nr:ABC transporter ATP-binding protein [Oscillospiraceae bacterium]